MLDRHPEQVLCHSGYEYAEYPIALYWHGERHRIEQIIARWRTPEGKSFRVRTGNGWEFEIFYALSTDSWRVELR